MSDISARGFWVGLGFWLLVMFFGAQEAACLPASCGSFDLFLWAVIGIGMLAPAWIISSVLSKPSKGK